MKQFVVMAERSAASIAGAAAKPCKKDGSVVYYVSKREAEDVARRYNRDTVSPNVSYRVLEVPDGKAR